MATRYQRGVIRCCNAKDRQYNGHKIPKGVIRCRNTKDRQYNGHKIPKGYSDAVIQRTDNTMATIYQRG